MDTFSIIFATLIINGRRKFVDTPENLKPQVKEILIEMGMGHLAE